MSWYDEIEKPKGKFIQVKEGQSAEFVVRSIKRNDNPKFSPKKRDGSVQPWALEVTDTDGRQMTVASFGLQFALIDQRIDEGDHIEISHPRRGVWKIIVLKRGEKSKDIAPF